VDRPPAHQPSQTHRPTFVIAAALPLRRERGHKARTDGGFRSGRAGELARDGWLLPLVTIAEVAPDKPRRPPTSPPPGCEIHTSRGRPKQEGELLPQGRAGELDRAVGRLLLVAVAEVRLEDAALGRHRLREVCDSYMRMPSETTASVSSPPDELGERDGVRRPRLLRLAKRRRGHCWHEGFRVRARAAERAQWRRSDHVDEGHEARSRGLGSRAPEPTLDIRQ
jgi:hypothetical protein